MTREFQRLVQESLDENAEEYAAMGSVDSESDSDTDD
jgi:hypothetical protein